METKVPEPSKSQCLRAGVELPPKRSDVWNEFERLCGFYVASARTGAGYFRGGYP